MNNTRKLILTAMFIAIGVVLPQAFHMIPNAGSILLPMHIPVLLSGYVVGPFYGLLCGFFTPLLSHILFAMPPSMVLPSMLVELSVYGLMSGLLYQKVKMDNHLLKNYLVLIGSMLCGRLSYGIMNALFFRAGNFSFAAWTSAAFVTALPGIVIQLILIPLLIDRLQKAGWIEK